MKRKVIVLADDFSGAAEIAGIGQRRGLDAEVQLEPDFSVSASLVVVDTDTRLLDETSAVLKLKDIARQLEQTDFYRFKKVDSAMRGHLAVEIRALVPDLESKRALLMPANPRKGRKIINGCYAIDDVPLHETVFKTDPVYPARTSALGEIIREPEYHRHLSRGEALPDHGLVTVDLESPSDFTDCLKLASKADLVCGAAECFEAYLEWLGFAESNQPAVKSDSRPFTLIVNGSTVKHAREKALFTRRNFPVFAMPGRWRNEEFIITGNELDDWYNAVSDSLSISKTVGVEITHSIKLGSDAAEKFNRIFTGLVKKIAGIHGLHQLNIGLTGGATASGIIRHLGLRQLKVVRQLSPGVVTLGSESGWEFTVKPGSYFWPEEFIKNEN